MPGSGIFISYRRDDSAGFAGRLYDRLAERFGASRVFMDIDTIAPGHEFVTDIEKALTECDACVVLIGRNWLTIADANGGRRLDDPTDFVRLEVATAIRRGITVFPVLVDKATTPPSAALPEDIRPLAGRQAIELTNERWNYDVGRLLLSLEEEVGGKEPPHGRSRSDTRSGTAQPKSRVPLIVAAVALFVLIAGGVAWLATRPSTDASPPASVTGSGTNAPLSGTYSVTVTLDALTGDLGNNLLWDVREPQIGDVFEAQDWVFSPPGEGSVWKIPARSAFSGTRQPDGSYTSDGSATCEGVPRAPVLRHLVVDSASGETAHSFEATLTIHWACGKDQPVDASFSVSGTR